MIVYALEFSDAVDLTAIGTLALAIVTVVLAVIGWRALKQTQSEIELSRRDVEEAHRPVVVPIIDPVGRFQIEEEQWVPAKPWMRGEVLIVPVQNIGSGPALAVRVSVTPREDGGGVSATWEEKRFFGVAPGIGVSVTVPVEIEIPTLQEVPSFEVWVTYGDVAERRWLTVARYVHSRGRYEEDSIKTLVEDGQPVR